MWSVVGRFTTVGEAESARSALEAANIESRIDDENTIAVDWLYSNALGGAKVLVRTERRQEAIEILSTAAEPSPDIEPGDERLLEPEQAEVAPSATGSRCPACRSADVERVSRLKLLGTIALVTYGAGAPAVDRRSSIMFRIGVSERSLCSRPQRPCSSFRYGSFSPSGNVALAVYGDGCGRARASDTASNSRTEHYCASLDPTPRKHPAGPGRSSHQPL